MWRPPPALLIWTGVVLAIAALFLPWYEVSQAFPYGHTISAMFYTSSVQEASSGPGASWMQAFTYSAYPLSATGTLYAVAIILLAASVILGVIAGVPRLRGRVSPSLLVVLVLIAMALSAAAPLVVGIEQPTAICADAQHFNVPLGGGAYGCRWQFDMPGGATASGGSWNGPQTSFVGQANGGTWGPSFGWFASFAASAAFGGGAFLA
jgi:hypothetical protein